MFCVVQCLAQWVPVRDKGSKVLPQDKYIKITTKSRKTQRCDTSAVGHYVCGGLTVPDLDLTHTALTPVYLI